MSETTPASPQFEGLRFEQARRVLGIPRWKMRVAVAGGLLRRDSRGIISAEDIEKAAADPSGFSQRCWGEERVVATIAAEQLSISRVRFREAAAAGVFTPIEVVQWRYGEAKYYRRADLEDGRERLARYQEQRVPQRRPPDPARTAAVRAAAVRRNARHQAARTARAAIFAPLDTLPTADQRLAAAITWLGVLDSHIATYTRRVPSASRARLRRQYEAEETQLRGIFNATVAGLIAAADPRLDLHLANDGSIQYCSLCMPADEIINWDAPSPPGCPQCKINSQHMMLEIETAVSGRREVFRLPFDTAAALPGLDSRLVSQPSRALLDEAAAGGARFRGRPPQIEAEAWASLTPGERTAAQEQESQRIATARLAGQVPTEELPAWMASLPRAALHSLGKVPFYRQLYTEYERKALPATEAVDGLRAALHALGITLPPEETLDAPN